MQTVLERFLRYVAMDTQSDPNSDASPSTEKQKVLLSLLVDELKELGASDARMDEYGYVYASIPATPGYEGLPKLGFLAHADTSSDAPGADVKARVVENYDGGDIVLNEKEKILLSPKDYDELLLYVGQDIVVTDGTTLLGSDDKAGVAEIMTLAERLLTGETDAHGEIMLAFTPDEEVGRGTEHFSTAEFKADYAYTVDGGRLGEIEFENFNAASAVFTVYGISIHPGTSKGKMKNALLIANELVNMFPPCETPACTEGYEGFFHLMGIKGSVEQCVVNYIIRDHDREKYDERKARAQKIADYLNDKYGAGTVHAEIKDTYRNMREMIEPHMHLIESAKAAMTAHGIEPIIQPIRGGTDGANLSFMGVPCPNLSTGGHNFHGRFEYIPVQSMEKMTQVLYTLATARR